MPTYSYRCSHGHTWEEFHKIDDRYKSEACSQCGGAGMLVISPPSNHFFREGWYEHLGIKPEYITSRRQLIDACKRANVTSTYYMHQ